MPSGFSVSVLFSPCASVCPTLATDCHLTFSVRSDGEEKKSEREAEERRKLCMRGVKKERP